MKTLEITITVLTLSALAFAQPTVTAEFATTSNLSPTRCTLGPQLTCKTGSCPTCAVTQGTGAAWAALDFPNNVLTCVVLTATAPNNVDPVDPVTMRVPYTRLGGGTGSSPGGVCSGQCAFVQVQVASMLELTSLGSPPFGNVTVSDALPAGGPNFPGKKATVAVRDIRISGLTGRNPVAFKICRDARPTYAADTLEGTLRITNSIFIVWHTVQGR